MKASVMAVLGGVLLGLPSDAAARTLVTVKAPTPISVYGKRFVYSAYDVRTRRFALTLYENGASRRLAVPVRRVPFDADLSPDGRGGLQIVYSRCRRKEPVQTLLRIRARLWRQGRGCRVHRLNVRSGVERRVPIPGGFLQTYLPAAWGTRLIFAGARAGSGAQRVAMYAMSAGKVRRLGAGTGGERATYGPLFADLRGRRYTYQWGSAAMHPPCTHGGGDTELGSITFDVLAGGIGAPQHRAISICPVDIDVVATPTVDAHEITLLRGRPAPAARQNEVILSRLTPQGTIRGEHVLGTPGDDLLAAVPYAGKTILTERLISRRTIRIATTGG